MTILDVEVKTTGQLIDELTILDIRISVLTENRLTGQVTDGDIKKLLHARELARQTRTAIAKRLADDYASPTLSLLVVRLKDLNKEIWKLIDIVYSGHGTGELAKQIQHLNEARNATVREIDQFLNERDIGEKTYATAKRKP